MSQHLTSAASSGIKHNGPPPPPPPKKEGLRHFVQENVGKVIVQPDGTEPNSRHLGDQRKSHFTSREVTTEHPSEHGETGSLSPSRAGVEGVVLTGVGRAHMNQGVMRVVDEARWNLHSQQDTNHEFATVLSLFGDKNQSLIKSPFLVSLFEDVTKRTGMTGMTKGSEGISFLESYVPLYWCYSEIIQSGANADHSSQQDIQYLQFLRYWYEKWVLSVHNKVRETIHSGFIAFDDIWALFRPGEMVCSQDGFKQPEMSIVTAMRYQYHPMPPHGRPPVPPPPGAKMTPIERFDGSRLIRDLEIYPLAQRVVVDSSRRPRVDIWTGNPSKQLRMSTGPVQVFGCKTPIEVGHGVPEELPLSEEFSALQACICPSTLQCCAPSTFTWYSVTIDSLKPISYEKEAMKSLVIPKETKTLLLGLIEEHRRTESQGALTDFIANKGESLIIVLNGPPGVGKTLTADKPLFSISLAQLSDEEQIDERLQKILDYSVSLGGVLLSWMKQMLYWKQDHTKTFDRGKVFLRMLEYYQGILLLTSNRMKSIDMAFQSRISIGVKFDHMSPETRKQIWTNFIGRFDSSNRVARDELTRRIEDIKKWPLNGRQIRNILRLAESLAFAQEKRRGALRFTHVERIATETLNFQEIFQEESSSSRSHLARIGNREFSEKRAPQSYRPSGLGESWSYGG
ncbi:hypothetical protein LA080_016093 [Diaporthe eres]|nr:hypothetical protein LA080_016093 [Diaporthe eres]